MEFRVLGPVAFKDRDGWHEPRGRLRRRLLATLLARVGQVVSHHQLAVALWGDPDGLPPMSRLHLQVHRLRQEIGQRDRITAADDGYLLHADPEEVDSLRFEALARTALAADRHDVGAGDAARQALEEWAAPWAGAAYDGIDTTPCLDEASRLAAVRLDVAEVWFDTSLNDGRPLDVLGDLTSLAGDHPLRESLQALMMRALHQAGRQQEALDIYRRTRTRLVEELGLEPSTQLRAVQELILTGAEPLTVAPTVPAQLPPVPDLVGREADLGRLEDVLAGPTSGPCILTGPPGVGKTALAITWAARHHADFPDGQLFVDLRGFSRDEPLPVDDALDGFIRVLGGDPSGLRSTADRTATYRSLAAGRRLLVVLDNARTPEQVRPLLPSAPDARALVTSRDRLGGLTVRDHARQVEVGRLPLDEALVVLRGTEPTSEPHETHWHALAERCGRLPLLLRVAAERVRVEPGDLGRLGAAEVDAETLDLLDFGDADSSARSLFSWSYRALPAEAAALFRALGVVPVAEVDVTTLAAMVQVDLRTARRAADQLARAHLVGTDQGWVHQHDLIAAYGRECADELDRDEREAMYVRGLERWSASLREAGRWDVGDDLDVDQPMFADLDAAEAWRQRALLPTVALCVAAPAVGDREVAYLNTLIHSGLAAGHLDQARRLNGVALPAARRLADPRIEGQTEGVMATVAGDAGDREGSLRHFERAVELLTEHGRLRDIVATHNNFGLMLATFGELQPSRQEFDRALQAFVVADPADVAPLAWLEPIVQANLGRTLWRLEQYDESERLLERALERIIADGREAHTSGVLATLGWVALSRQRPTEAARFGELALDRARRIADTTDECYAGLVLGAADLQLGDPERARERCGAALALAERAGRPIQVVLAITAIGDVLAASDDPEAALAHYERATVAARHRGFRLAEAAAVAGQAAVLRATGRQAEASIGDEQVARLRAACGLPVTLPVRLRAGLPVGLSVKLSVREPTGNDDPGS